MLRTGKTYMIRGIKYVFLGVYIAPKVRLVFRLHGCKKFVCSPDWIALHSDEIEAV